MSRAYRLPSAAVQFGGWKPPTKESNGDSNVAVPGKGQTSIQLQLGTIDGDKLNNDRGNYSKASESKDRHKKRKKHKKEKHQKRKRGKDKKRSKRRKRSRSHSPSSSSSADIDAVLDSRLNPEDWMAQRLAKGYAKAERAEKRKALRKSTGTGQGIAALRAEWSGGDMAGIRAPQDMCRSGLEG